MSSIAPEVDVVTLGETMIRLSPPSYERLETTRSLDLHVGGSETNTGIALSRMGKRVSWWSRLPANALGAHITSTLRMHGVDTSQVKLEGARVGTYFVEFGAPPRPTQVIYDRAASAASQMQPDDFDWSRLKRARWLHITGITPALSESCMDTVLRAVSEANAARIPVSFDLNYRAKLWTPDQARAAYDVIAPKCSLVIGAVRDARLMFDVGTPEDLYSRWQVSVVLTRGAEGADAYDGKTAYHADAYPMQVVDRVGAGDAFDAGLLCALLDGKPMGEALRMGNATAALKLTIPGDIALVSRAEVEYLLQSGSSLIQR